MAALIVQIAQFLRLHWNKLRSFLRLSRSKGALLVVVFTEAVALGLIRPPAEADIVAGELQSFAISPSYGGPYAGIIATREKYMRQLPGRLVGETTDSGGNRAFCLTLATREQHIRREKATSNICTNQALLALMATVFMSVYGREGLRELAEQNLAKAHYLADSMVEGLRCPLLQRIRRKNQRPVARRNKQRASCSGKIIGGLPLGRFYPELKDCMLLCATEMSKRSDMDQVRRAFEQHDQESLKAYCSR